jgi:transposase-like protein
MSHRKARLNVRGRLLLVERALGLGRPVAHVAKELGVSRQCAHRWIRRYRTEGAIGLHDRPSWPRRSPRRTSLSSRRVCCRCGASSDVDRTGSAPSWVSRRVPSGRCWRGITSPV